MKVSGNNPPDDHSSSNNDLHPAKGTLNICLKYQQKELLWPKSLTQPKNANPKTSPNVY